jgi:hypothetical protein
MDPAIHFIMLGLGSIFSVTKFAAQLLASFPFFLIPGGTYRLGNVIGLAIQLFDLLHHFPTPGFKFDQFVDLAGQIPVGTIALHRLGIFHNEFAVQHRI